MVKRAWVLLVALTLVPWGLGSAPAQAAVTPVTISGTIDVSNAGKLSEFRFCRDLPDPDCSRPSIDGAGKFSITVDPGSWNVEISGFTRSLNWHLTQTMLISESDEGHLAMPQPVRVEIHAETADGSPLKGAEVQSNDDISADPVVLSPDLAPFSATQSFYKETKESGEAAIWTLPDADLDLPVKAGISGGVYRLPLTTLSRTSVDASSDVTVEAQALPLHTVSLALSDTEGRVVPSLVHLEGSWGQSDVARVTTTGAVELLFPDGHADLSVLPVGRVWYLPRTWQAHQPITVDGNRVLTLRLPETTKVSGHVLEQGDQTPIENASVTASGDTEAVLESGEASAVLTNGGHDPLKASSKPDGSFGFRVFPDDDLGLRATIWDPGVYRTSSLQQVDARADVSTEISMPTPALVELDIADADGTPIEGSTADLRVSEKVRRAFDTGANGRPQMLMSPGPATIEVQVADPQIRVTRDVEVTGDAVFEVHTPEPIDLAMLALSKSGYPVRRSEVHVIGSTFLDTEEGPVPASFEMTGVTDAHGEGDFAMPPLEDAVINAFGGYRARHLDLTTDRSIVIVDHLKGEGSGIPYVRFEAIPDGVNEPSLTAEWESSDAEDVTVSRLVFRNSGTTSTTDVYTGSVAAMPPLMSVDAPMGALTCLGATAQQDGVTGPMSILTCQLRPVDDADLNDVGRWKQVSDPNAYGGGYKQTAQRGAELTVAAVKKHRAERVGELALLARMSPHAGTVRVRIGDSWVSRSLSLSGPSTGESVTIPIHIGKRHKRVHGKLRVIVVSDGRPVQIDGVTIPLVPEGHPFGSIVGP